jgi:hypothetical protein
MPRKIGGITKTGLAAILLAAALSAVASAQSKQENPPPNPDSSQPAPAPRAVPERMILPTPPSLQARPSSSVVDQSETLLGRSPEALPPLSRGSVIRAILGFVALLALAYAGGTVPIRNLERRLNFARMISSGLPFVAAGLIASLPQVGILTPAVIDEIDPLLPIGLGWIGFVIGARFQARSFEGMRESTGAAALISTAVPVAMVFGALVWVIWAVSPQQSSADFIRSSLLLATAGAVAARSAPEFLQFFTFGPVASLRLKQIVDLEQLAGIFGLMMLSAYYRPNASLVAWHLAGTGWLFVTIGIGTAMGIVAYATFTHVNNHPQFNAVLLGCVAFTAGTASYLRLSPLAVCFFAGAIATNLGGEWKQQVRQALERLERPVYFLLLIIAGALWRPWDWRGWALMAVFVVTRFAAKWIASEGLLRMLIKELHSGERRVLTLAPMGALSVAIVVSAQDLYSGGTMPWIFTAVIGASVVNGIVLQLIIRKREPQAVEANSLAPASSQVD